VNDNPPQIALSQHVVGPDNRSDGFRATPNAGDDVLPNIRIETLRALGRIMQPSDRESHGDGQPHAIVTDRFLQDDKAAGVFLFIRNDAAKRDFTPEGIQRILRIEDGGFDAKHFELLQVAATGITDSDECR
jgi:hypothetical protein